MPRIKKEREFFPIEFALLYQPEITHFAAKNLGIFRGFEEYKILVNFACHPLHRRGLSVNKQLLENFARLYSRTPDAVIEFLIVARSVLNKWGNTKAGKVIIFLCRHNLIPIEDRHVVYDSNGARISVSIINKFNGRKKTVSFDNKTDDEISRLSFPKMAHAGTLSDKEIATLLELEVVGINSEIVKKARQELAKIYHEIKFWRNPTVIEYYKTGVKTEELELIAAQYLKGKR